MVAEMEALSRMLPPPPRVVASPPWDTSAAEVGFAFPADYRAFIDRYGGGFIRFSDNAVELIIHAPCSVSARPYGSVGFREFMDRTDDVRSEFDFDGADDEIWYGDPYPIFPDEGGLVVWGETSVGDILFWLTEDRSPDRWSVVVWPRHEERIYKHDGGMLSFLAAQLHGSRPVHWLGGRDVTWTMKSDWLERGLSSSAGPARGDVE